MSNKKPGTHGRATDKKTMTTAQDAVRRGLEGGS